MDNKVKPSRKVPSPANTMDGSRAITNASVPASSPMQRNEGFPAPLQPIVEKPANG